MSDVSGFLNRGSVFGVMLEWEKQECTRERISIMPNNNDMPSDNAPSENKIVLVVPPDNANGGEVSLIDLWNIIWRGKVIVITASALFAILAVTYSLLATEWYKADVLLVSSDDNSMQDLAGRLGGLAGLAGINVGRGNSNEALAVLSSRELTRSFISERELLTVLLHEEWDAQAGRWLAEDEEVVRLAARDVGSRRFCRRQTGRPAIDRPPF